MIEERAVVVKSGKSHVWVEVQRHSACGSCGASEGCGTAALGKFWSGRRVQVRAIATEPLQVGEKVYVGLADGVLLRGSFLVYSLPLLLLLVGALLGQVAFAGTGEELVVLSGVLGLSLGFLAVRVLSKRFESDSRFQPRVLRRITEVSAVGVLSQP
ncbi:MAG: SoxR reducing system RseC family protein [Phycisphaerales bacterium]|nr:SoxR reducing system RseC family protein [Phycisphaerales bacterium]